MKMIRISLLFFSWLIMTNIHSQQLNGISLTGVENSREIEFSDVLSSDKAVIIFSSSECPFDEYYISRLNDLKNDPGFSSFTFLKVHSNGEFLKDIKEMASKSAIPHFMDKEQRLFKALSGNKTPEVFLITYKDSQATVLYRGAIDNNPQMASAVTESYLKDALLAVSKNQKPKKKFVRPMGCVVKEK